MNVPPGLKSEIDYAKDLVGAGLDAATSVVKGAAPEPMASLAHVSQISLAPAILCAAAGVAGAFLVRKGRPGDAILGGLVGCAIGFTGGMAWGTRDRTKAFARNASKNVRAVRDAHWLEKNPVAYA